MWEPNDDLLTDYKHALELLTQDLIQEHPKVLLLFGSMARYLVGQPLDHMPKDLDLLMIGGNYPVEVQARDYGTAFELHYFSVHQVIEIAKSLRYDTRAMALTKLYSKTIVIHHAKNIIVASLLLGPSYGEFGIEQIEVDSLTDQRDYSIHRVLYGEPWWQRITQYARQRRGPLKRFSDMLAGIDQFDP
jgi:hypothetical protein